MLIFFLLSLELHPKYYQKSGFRWKLIFQNEFIKKVEFAF
jgi:hypothetical protein